jgi:hypothetical protein
VTAIRYLLVMGALAVVTAGCGGSHGQAAAGQSRACLSVPQRVTKAIAATLDRGKLHDAAAVKSRGDSPLPAFAGGFYLVRVDVKPNPGVSTYAVENSLFHGGGGIVASVDESAAAASPDIAEGPQVVDGYDTLQNCA